MTRRKWIAAGVLMLWLGGLGLLTRRELFPSEERRREKAALLIEPVSHYYMVEEGGTHVGYATSQVDTSLLGIMLRRSLVVSRPGEVDSSRAAVQYTAQLSQRLRLVDFSIVTGTAAERRTLRARSVGDSSLELEGRSRVAREGGAFQYREAFADTVRFDRAAVTPEVAPLVLALGRTLRTGDQFDLVFFDRATRELSRLQIRIEAESLFTVPDSARFDEASGVYVTAHSDTVRAWRVSLPGEGGGAGWFDRSGQPVLQELGNGRSMRRTAFEMAFENWRAGRDSTQLPADIPLPKRPEPKSGGFY